MNTSIRFPLDESKETLALFKTYSKKTSEVIEISYPNDRVKALKIVTRDYTLYIKAVKSQLEQLKVIAGELKGILDAIEIKTTGNVPLTTITLNKESLIQFSFNYETLQSFKCKAKGWYVLEDEEISVDFF